MEEETKSTVEEKDVALVESVDIIDPNGDNTKVNGRVQKRGISGSDNIKVVCRFRPQNKMEKKQKGKVSVEFDTENPQIAKVQANQFDDSTHSFSFDRVYDMSSTQEQVYETVGKPVVDAVLEGYNGTVFAYGQTSSGKTYTMEGPDHEPGLVPRMVSALFDCIAAAPQGIEYSVTVSMIEIYLERVNDLLDVTRSNLQIREDTDRGIWVDGAKVEKLSQPGEILEVMKTGQRNRSTASTKMNNYSSRSHSLFILTVHQRDLTSLRTQCGKLFLVDLAGSEKIRKTGATGARLEEAKMINKSLSTLGNVINALTEPGVSHIPYRDSKLTRVLQESLGGNSKTALVICCSPSSFNISETVSTMRFGARAKLIKNQAKINEEFSASELQILLEKAQIEISTLKTKMRESFKAAAKGNPDIIGQQVVQELETRLSCSEREQKKLQDMVTHLEAGCQEAEAALNAERDKHARTLFDLREESNGKENELRRSSEEAIDKLRDIYKTTEAQFKDRVVELEEKLKTLQVELETSKKQGNIAILEVQQSFAQHEASLRMEHQEQLLVLQTTCNENEAKLQSATTERDSLQLSNENLSNREKMLLEKISLLERTVSQQSDEILQLQKAKHTVENNLQEATAFSNKSLDAISHLEVENKTLTSTIGRLTHDLAEKDEEIVANAKLLEQYVGALAHADQETQDYLKELNMLKEKLATERENLKQCKDQYQDASLSMQGEANNLAIKIESLEKMLEEERETYSKSLQGYQVRCTELTSELEYERSKHLEKSISTDAILQQSEALRIQLEQAKVTCDNLEKEKATNQAVVEEHEIARTELLKRLEESKADQMYRSTQLLEKLKTFEAESKQQYSELQTKNTALTEQLGVTTCKLKDTVAQLQASNEERASFQIEMETKLKESSQETLKKTQGLQRLSASKDIQLINAQAKITEMQAEVNKLKLEMRNKSELVLENNSTLAQEQEEKALLYAKLSELECSHGITKATLSEKDEQLESLRKRAQELENHIERQVQYYSTEMERNQAEWERHVQVSQQEARNRTAEAEEYKIQLEQAKENANKGIQREREIHLEEVVALKKIHKEALLQAALEAQQEMEQLQGQAEKSRNELRRRLKETEERQKEAIKAALEPTTLRADSGNAADKQEIATLKDLLAIQDGKLVRQEQRIQALQDKLVNGSRSTNQERDINIVYSPKTLASTEYTDSDEGREQTLEERVRLLLAKK